MINVTNVVFWDCLGLSIFILFLIFNFSFFLLGLLYKTFGMINVTNVVFWDYF